MKCSWMRWNKIFVFFLLLLFQISGWFGVAGEAIGESAKKNLRIGYFEDNNGFQNGFSDEKRKSGYAYEYYQNIARLNGWKYQYVYGSWNDIYLKLLHDEVDIVAGISKSEERIGKILYPEYPMGTESYYIFVPVNYDEIQGSRVSSLNGKRIGVNANSLMFTLFTKFVQENSLACEIKTYPSHTGCAQALNAGDIDGYVITDNYVVAGVKPVMKIGKSDIYFGVNKQRPDILAELNQAQEQILASSPYYNNYLQSKYFDRSVLRLALNDAELSWLKKTEQITIGCIDNKLPYCDMDSADGKCRGTIVTLQRELKKFLNINVKLKTFPNSSSMLKALRRGEVQVIFPAYGDIWHAERQQLSISNSLLKIRAIAIYLGQYDSAMLKRVAVTKDNSILVPYLNQYYPESKIVFYDNLDSCLAALRAGQVGSVIDDSNFVMRYLNNTGQEQNFRLAYLDNPIDLSFAVLRGENILQAILDKAIVKIDRAILTEALMRNAYVEAPYSLNQFICHNPIFVVLLLSGVLLALVVIFIGYRKSSLDNRRQLTMANEQLRKYEIQTSETLSGARVGLWTLELPTEETPRLYCDATMLKLLGIEAELTPESCYKIWQQGILPENLAEINNWVDKVLTTGRAEISYPWKHPVLGIIFVRLGGVADLVHASGGSSLRGYFQDITETAITKLKMEEAQREAESKSIFLSSMSHEIRTPLNAVIGFSELLESGDLPEQERNEYLHNINISGKALLSLINDILDLSKLEAEQMKYQSAPCDLQELINNVAQVFTLKLREKNLQLSLEISSDLPLVMVDEQRIRQVIFNLLGNAVKFTDSGFIKIVVEYNLHRERVGHLVIQVIDSGCGISEEFKKKLFTPFAQANEIRDSYMLKGTGLGLAISKRLVNGMGGELKVESNLGQGSCFSVDFPEIRSSERVVKIVPPSSVAHRLGGRVLIVDDITLNLRVLSAMLKKCGIDSISASSGSEAMSILEREYSNIMLVLTDLWMPGMSGIELAKLIRQDRRFDQMPIVAVSADVELKKSAGADIFSEIVYKPVALESLKKLFASLLS